MSTNVKLSLDILGLMCCESFAIFVVPCLKPVTTCKHRTKFQESVNENVAETCGTFPETQRITCVSVSGFVTFTRVSVAAYTAEPDHIFFMFPSSFS